MRSARGLVLAMIGIPEMELVDTGCCRETQGPYGGSAKSLSPARNRHGTFNFSALIGLLFKCFKITMIAQQRYHATNGNHELIDILLQLVAEQ